MRGESLKRLGQLGGRRKVRRVVRVEFNDIGTSVLCDHPALQREWDGAIPLGHPRILVDAAKRPRRNGLLCDLIYGLGAIAKCEISRQRKLTTIKIGVEETPIRKKTAVPSFLEERIPTKFQLPLI